MQGHVGLSLSEAGTVGTGAEALFKNKHAGLVQACYRHERSCAPGTVTTIAASWQTVGAHETTEELLV